MSINGLPLLICCCSITKIAISLFPHILHWIHMKNQEKFTTCSNKLKEHRASLQTISSYPDIPISYPDRFPTDILVSSLVSFPFCLLVIFGFVFLNLKILWYTFDYTGGWAIKNFNPADFWKQDYFFWPKDKKELLRA